MKESKTKGYLYLTISSSEDPKLISIVFKNSPIDKSKEIARQFYGINPTAYNINIRSDTAVLFNKDL